MPHGPDSKHRRTELARPRFPRLLALVPVIMDEFGDQMRLAIKQLARPDTEPHDTPHCCRYGNVEQLYAVFRKVVDRAGRRGRSTRDENREEAARVSFDHEADSAPRRKDVSPCYDLSLARTAPSYIPQCAVDYGAPDIQHQTIL